ncbi:MAG TPA: 3'-5' exonuclease [Pseudolabrys sp.]|nr:3'-5' exonuclease [Pseudolabrys sp.]
MTEKHNMTEHAEETLGTDHDAGASAPQKGVMIRHPQQTPVTPAAAPALDGMARELAASGDYKVLRRLAPQLPSPARLDGSEQTGIVIDLETTGLDPSRDEIIELAMIQFRYSASGEITGVSDVFQSFNEPSVPIPTRITQLTGIADPMVAGQRIDAASVDAFVADAQIVIAHNAGFDRKFGERGWPIFMHMAWGCSATEIDWQSYGLAGGKLAYLATHAGFFYDAHRAVDDCHALLELLSRPLSAMAPQTALSLLLDRAQRTTVRIWAERSPYDLKEVLKARGYRWNNGEDGAPRAWFVDVEEECRDAEFAFLRNEIYQREVDLRWVSLTAFERFSARIGVKYVQRSSTVPAGGGR